ncbi:hypothetical protein A7309_26090 [Paenibacillus polymyxa]|nr:hypothetical protein A7309_26090 [Paenibacillus polymyxa]
MSALALTPAFVAGMAIGRFDLTRIRTALILAGSGIVMLVIGKTLATFVLPGWSLRFEQWLISAQGIAPMQPDEYAIWPLITLKIFSIIPSYTFNIEENIRFV